LVLTGLLLGIAFAFIAAHFLESVLYNVSASDPVSIILAVLMLVVAGFLACLLPALPVIRIDPITALRE
jgi:putative ABC transport system permease protein